MPQKFKFSAEETNAAGACATAEPMDIDWLELLQNDMRKNNAIRRLQAFVRGKHTRNIVTKKLTMGGVFRLLERINVSHENLVFKGVREYIGSDKKVVEAPAVDELIKKRRKDNIKVVK